MWGALGNIIFIWACRMGPDLTLENFDSCFRIKLLWARVAQFMNMGCSGPTDTGCSYHSNIPTPAGGSRLAA